MTDQQVLQATVQRYDPATGAGAVLLDDGGALRFAGGALRPPLRLLRAGQRVQLRVRAGEVEALTLVTLPLDL